MMGGLATGDIIADLRDRSIRGSWGHLYREAADRLAELDAEVKHWAATYERAMADWAEAERVIQEQIDALRPPCPTCGGKRIVRNLTTYDVVVHDPCPDCVDGKASIPWMAALFNAVHAYPHTNGQWADYLRGVR